MAAPARNGAGAAARLRVGERGLLVERRGRWARRLALPRDTPRVQVEEIQRSRLLAAAAAVIDEVGYEQASVARITDRARVSRRTFYELFGNREECLVALLDEVSGRVQGELAAAGLGGLAWRERVRGGLWVILSFLDGEPVLARICVVHALHGGPEALERRERLLASLVGVLDEGRLEGARGGECTLVTAEGLVGGAFGVVYARLRSGDRRPLKGLLDELMGMIALQYLGASAARREQRRAAPAPRPAVHAGRVPVGSEKDPLDEVDMRLTYRTARVLQCIAEQPGASNRGVAESAGVTDPGQISKLLGRLERLGLTVNTGGGHLSGEPNAWELTPLGGQVARRLSALTIDRTEASRAASPGAHNTTTTEGPCCPSRTPGGDN
ncbi:MAG TPA: TetR/AcrR family transcriptional regulator [Solirubrobacteraceae bacterium]|jgi:AcrR family transcriptional regulator|nr:TetR/AcrR family transcriptional regulator [Solirubrobacteraceae bacterium]